MDTASLWWNFISGAARYLHDSLAAVMNHSVLLVEEAPFIEKYFHLLEETLMQSDSSLLIETSMAYEWEEGGDMGDTVMNRYAPQADYHPMDGSRVEFIAKNQVLAGRVLIIRRIECRLDLLQFAVDYAKHSRMSNGLIILTYCGAPPLASARKGVAVFKWKSYISRYDMQLFASYCVADQPGLSPAERNYITQIASRMAGTDPELCQALATAELAKDPFALLQRLADDYEVAANIVKDVKFVKTVIWEAQIQIVFPIIERMRKHFIESYYDGLQKVLPQKDEFDKVLITPQDLELRHMWYYYFKTFGFRNTDDERTFQLVYKARNNLAHLDALNSEEVLAVFKLDEADADDVR